ncbi:MAG: EAL domain-containing protein [Sulfurimicrobium sp.]|nr:EAL domain-containing protein [Sulfurimicrobium sp.]
MNKMLKTFLREFTFRRQLGITITLGILCLALFSSLVSSWQGKERVRRNLIEQGQHITENLARQSALALLYASPDNAAEAVSATLAFPGVASVEIRDTGQRVLLAQGRARPAEFPKSFIPVAGAEALAVLDAESEGAWRFVAPVYSQPSAASPFQVQEARRERLGDVAVVMSKAELSQMTRDIFIANMISSFSFALLILILIRFLSGRMARPLRELSASMARAEAGESHVRAVLSGPKDIFDMAHAFNSMMAALEDRIAAVSHAERHIRHLAYNDTLTELPNRTQFMDMLNQTIDRARDKGQTFALLFLDLNRFKNVNDTLGHDVGDRLLIAAGRRIRHSVRADDSVARFGGDEFTVLMEDLAGATAALVASQNICFALATPFEIDGLDIYVSASIGISVYPADGMDGNTLLKHADSAMYLAKKNNSGHEFYEPGMEAKISDHVQMEGALRRAEGRNELLLYYQPKAVLATGALSGMEALVRWKHPEFGPVSPARFIPLAEETGLIVSIGAWVLRTACTQAKIWADAGMPLAVAVNLSGVQLRQRDFVDSVRAVLAETGLAPALLELEITESVLMEQAEETLSTLHQLKEIGVRLAIDDFGTGYSSLSYLKRFPVDTLKIDQSFVRDVTSDPDDAALVTGIIALAHSLRLKVVAEGVETAEQRDFLVRSDCDFIQGYLLSQPVPPEVFERNMLDAV